jgi:type II secretory pathway pseudopilin PulG
MLVVKTAKNSGYSLVELSISLTVIALLVTSGLTLFAKKSEAEKSQVTKEKIRVIEKAIVDYVDVNGFIPCPAKGTALESDQYFGDSLTNASYNTATHLCSNNTTNNVGMVPVRNLGLDDSYAYDGWDRKFSFQVAKGMGNAYDFSDSNYRGDISIVDFYGIERTNTAFPVPKNYGAAFVIISFGQDGIGAWGKNSSANPTAPSNTMIEYQNSKYLSSTNNIYIQDGIYSKFDDIVSFKNKLFLTTSRLSTSPIKVSSHLCRDANAIVTSGFSNGGYMSGGITGTVPTASASTDFKTQIYLSALKLQKLCNNPPLTATLTTGANTSCYFNPDSIAGLQLWLDANDTQADASTLIAGTKVNPWKDKSGNGNDATSAGLNSATVNTASIFPNSNTILYFDGLTNYYTIPLSSLANSNYTIFVVEANNGVISPGNTAHNTILNANPSNCVLLEYYYSANTDTTVPFDNLFSATIPGYFDYYFQHNNNASAIMNLSASSLIPVTPNLWVASFSTVNGQTLSVTSANGNVVSSSNSYTTSCVGVTGGVIGATTAGTLKYQGYIAEILIYNQTLTPSDINAIAGYLTTKWMTGECI